MTKSKKTQFSFFAKEIFSEKLQKIVRVQKYTCHKYQTTISWDNWAFYILQWQRVKQLNFRFSRKKFFLKNCKNSYEFKNICVINIKQQIDEIIKKWHPCQGKPVFSPTVHGKSHIIPIYYQTTTCSEQFRKVSCSRKL